MTRHQQALSILQSGVAIPAIPLVLTSERAFDADGQKRLVRYYAQAGAGGIAAAVHSTQFAIRDKKHNLLTPVLETVSKEIDRIEQESGKVLVKIAGVCGPTEQACMEAALAERLGYDAVLLSPGGLDTWTEEQMLERARSVAAVMPVIGFYMQKAVGGRQLSRDYWRRMADIPNLVAIKCACFDRYQTEDLVKGVMLSKRGDQVALYTGNDDHIIFDLLTPFSCVVEGQVKTKNFVGGLLGQWSVWTHTAVELFQACRECQKSGTVPLSLLTVAEQLTECNRAVFDAENAFAGCIPGIHYVLCEQGLMPGIWCLDPEETLSPGQAADIQAVRAAYPHITDDPFVREFLAREK